MCRVVIPLVAVLASVGCRAGEAISLPEAPPGPLAEPIGVDDAAAGSTGTTGPPAPATGVPIGAADPLRVVAAGPDGQWVALCRGRVPRQGGPAWIPRIVVGASDGIVVDRFVAFDPSGRHVAFVQDGELILLDTEQGTQVRLHSGVDASGRAWVDFDQQGQRIAYIAATEEGARVRVRSLADRSELEIHPGPGLPLAVHLGRRDELWVDVGTEGAPDDAPLGRRGSASEEISSRCQPTTRRRVGSSDASIETRLARIGSGRPAETVRGAIGPGNGGLFVGRDDQAVMLRKDDRETLWVPADCRGQVLAHDPDEPRLLVLCRSTEPPSVRIYTSRGPTELGPFDVGDVQPGRNGWVNRHHDTILLADPPRLLDVPEAEHVVHATRRFALVRRAGDHAIVAIPDGHIRTIPGKPVVVDPAKPLHAGAMVVARGEDGARVVDLERGRISGRTDRMPLAVTRSGHVLVPRHRDHDPPRGPLEWIAP